MAVGRRLAGEVRESTDEPASPIAADGAAFSDDGIAGVAAGRVSGDLERTSPGCTKAPGDGL